MYTTFEEGYEIEPTQSVITCGNYCLDPASGATYACEGTDFTEVNHLGQVWCLTCRQIRRRDGADSMIYSVLDTIERTKAHWAAPTLSLAEKLASGRPNPFACRNVIHGEPCYGTLDEENNTCLECGLVQSQTFEETEKNKSAVFQSDTTMVKTTIQPRSLLQKPEAKPATGKKPRKSNKKKTDESTTTKKRKTPAGKRGPKKKAVVAEASPCLAEEKTVAESSTEPTSATDEKTPEVSPAIKDAGMAEITESKIKKPRKRKAEPKPKPPPTIKKPRVPRSTVLPHVEIAEAHVLLSESDISVQLANMAAATASANASSSSSSSSSVTSKPTVANSENKELEPKRKTRTKSTSSDDQIKQRVEGLKENVKETIQDLVALGWNATQVTSIIRTACSWLDACVPLPKCHKDIRKGSEFGEVVLYFATLAHGIPVFPVEMWSNVIADKPTKRALTKMEALCVQLFPEPFVWCVEYLPRLDISATMHKEESFKSRSDAFRSQTKFEDTNVLCPSNVERLGFGMLARMLPAILCRSGFEAHQHELVYRIVALAWKIYAFLLPAFCETQIYKTGKSIQQITIRFRGFTLPIMTTTHIILTKLDSDSTLRSGNTDTVKSICTEICNTIYMADSTIKSKEREVKKCLFPDQKVEFLGKHIIATFADDFKALLTMGRKKGDSFALTRIPHAGVKWTKNFKLAFARLASEPKTEIPAVPEVSRLVSSSSSSSFSSATPSRPVTIQQKKAREEESDDDEDDGFGSRPWRLSAAWRDESESDEN